MYISHVREGEEKAWKLGGADMRMEAAVGGGVGGSVAVGVESIRVFFSSASPLVLIAKCQSEMAARRDGVRGNGCQ